MDQLGYERLALYDGSMGEWAKDEETPMETG
jgi:thiosulfate/3-mercaptopyruvate sulfurtransferase